jgi:hypothetical protein
MNTLLPGTRFEGKPKEKGHLNDTEMDSVPKCPERKDTDPGLNLS